MNIFVQKLIPLKLWEMGEKHLTLCIDILQKCCDFSNLYLFRFRVSSLSKINLTVSVEDEYTFFSPDQPLLAGATVTLISSFTQETFSLITNTSGKIKRNYILDVQS